MNDERRRYFRINDTVGISYKVLESGESSTHEHMPDVLDLVSKQDRQIERLLVDLQSEHPQVTELVSLINQKLERVISQLVLDTQLVERIAHRVKEANISACGIAFENDEGLKYGARVSLELTLYPSEKVISTNGYVVGCDKSPEDDTWFVRIDFYNMSDRNQELLIQHIVQSQSAQLKAMRDH